MMSHSRLSLLGPAVALMASGCTPHRAPPDLFDPAQAAAAYAAMLPDRVIVHPLTRVGVDAEGKPAVLAHVELRDKYNQNTRALGTFRMTCAPGPGASGGAGGESISWDIDLRDPEENAKFFDDLVTRTYVLTLTGLPAWLTVEARVGVGASFTFPDVSADGGARTLTDSGRLGR